MEEAPEQLSLALFESDPPANPGRTATVRAAKPRRSRSVASSRSQSPPNEGELAAAPTHGLLTTRETADRLRVHVRTVQRLVERGELESVHLGGAVRFDPADVAELTARLKRCGVKTTRVRNDTLRPTRAVRISFAERLRSPRDEHRAP